MRRFTYYLLTGFSVIFLAGCEAERTETSSHEHHVHTTPEPTAEDLASPKSIPREAHGQVDDVHVAINYYSPGVRDRMIWGGLVAYNQVWVTGAHSATNITFSSPVIINGQRIPAGKYAFFTIPGKDTWTIILNKNWDQHLTDDYSEEEDVIRIEVLPTEADFNERLKYEIEDLMEGKGQIKMSWEKIAIDLQFNTDAE